MIVTPPLDSSTQILKKEQNRMDMKVIETCRSTFNSVILEWKMGVMREGKSTRQEALIDSEREFVHQGGGVGDDDDASWIHEDGY
jgi:hypothetical protein